MVLRVTPVVSLLLGLLWFGSIFLRFLGSSGLVQGRSLALVLSLCISILLLGRTGTLKKLNMKVYDISYD